MSHKPPSQLRILLLLAASLVAGLIVSTALTQRKVTRDAAPSQFSVQSLIAESP